MLLENFLKVCKENFRDLIIKGDHLIYGSGSAITEEESKHSAVQWYNVYELY